jgi:hypothetical protein
MAFFKFIELQYDKLDKQIKSWLSGVYNKSDINFTSASPHGMIVNNLKEYFQHTIIYLKNSLLQIDINNTYNEKAIRSIARISGHNATRAISASGVIKLKLKEGVNLTDDIGTNTIVITNNTTLKNKTNGLFYTIITNEEFSNYNFSNTKEIYLNVLQGKFETQTFTGNGLESQSFSVNVTNNILIDNFNVFITYNGLQVELKDSLFDLLPNSYQCYTRTGINGGLDVYFGTNNYGFIPDVGSKIIVRYLVTDGTIGDIINRNVNDFKFVDNIVSSNGDIITVEDYFDVLIEKDISFSSDGETAIFTKNILPYVSRNFVLATPDQFVYHLKRLNIFSQVFAYNLLNDYDAYNKNKIIDSLIKNVNDNVLNDITKQDMLNKIEYLSELNITNDNKIFLYLIPDISKYFTKDVNYFNIPLDAFYLDDDEKQKVHDYLKKMGILIITSDVEIVQPIISKFVMNIYVRRFDDTIEDNVRQEIITTVSNYFINNQRFDRVVKSDIIRTLKNSNSIDSIDLNFISESNEIYHKEGLASKGKAPKILEKPVIIKSEVMYEIKNYDSSLTIGLDPLMGDIVVDKNEMPIIRGGWSNKDGVYYNETPSEKGLGPINIIFNGITKRK